MAWLKKPIQFTLVQASALEHRASTASSGNRFDYPLFIHDPAQEEKHSASFH